MILLWNEKRFVGRRDRVWMDGYGYNYNFVRPGLSSVNVDNEHALLHL